ncbi:MAG: sigma 54-interacting transcriptional regulator [Polyangiaceae bacterium]
MKSRLVWLVRDDGCVDPDLRRLLESSAWEVVEYVTSQSALDAAAPSAPAVILLSLDSTSTDPGELLDTFRAAFPVTSSLGLLDQRLSSHPELFRRDAHSYLVKPVLPDQLLHSVTRAADCSLTRNRLEQLEHELNRALRADPLVGESSVMQRLGQQIHVAAAAPTPVSVFGEAGSGKKLVARALHQGSTRREGPLVVFNCSIKPRSLHRAELFEAGFTDRPSCYAAATGGSLVLEDLSELAPDAQDALMERLIADRGDPSAPRIVCVDRRPAIASPSKFRKDLLAALTASEIEVPPLRERIEDIPSLIGRFIDELHRESGRRPPRISQATLDALSRYAWPGNVRELRSLIQRAALSVQGDRIEPVDLPQSLQELLTPEPVAPTRSDLVPRGEPEVLNLRELERRAIQRALEVTDGCMSRAARLLGIGRATIYRKLASFEAERRDLRYASESG